METFLEHCEVHNLVFMEGYRAYLNGESECANPYRNINRHSWAQGWEAAYEDHVKEGVM